MSTSKKQAAFRVIGRDQELGKLNACLKAERNVLLEGPVGVGKTHLALGVLYSLGRPVFRVDGDSRYSEQKLTGWFDPPSVVKKGFTKDSFIPGPLIDAMKQGGVLFINELNRLPEGVQNVLLPAIDERVIVVPRLGEIRAAQGFLVIATQNPKEFVATSHLSEAILDRFELVMIDYQSEEEEQEIVVNRLKERHSGKFDKSLPLAAVRLARATRQHPRVRRGASVRAAVSVAEIAVVLMGEGQSLSRAFLEAALMALPTRIEIEREAESELSAHSETEGLLRELTESILKDLMNGDVKKKS